MPNLESKPITTSIKIDPAHNLEMRADLAAKTAEVENLVTGEMYSGGGGGDSDFSTAEITFTGSTMFATLDGASFMDTEGYTGSSPGVSAGLDAAAASVILYKGKAIVEIVPEMGESITITATGSAQDMGRNTYLVTGDCNFEILPE